MAGQTGTARVAGAGLLARRHGNLVARLLRAVAGDVPLAAQPGLGDLPWVQTLDGEHLRTFLEEYASAYQDVLASGQWQRLDELLLEWQATAEAFQDPDLRRLLDADTLPADERLPLDYPA